MANQAAKKTDARTKEFRSKFGWALLIVVLFHALVRFVVFKSSWERTHTYAFAGGVVALWVSYKTILGHIESGGQMYDKGAGLVELSVDTLYIVAFATVLGSVWGNAWWFTVLVPMIIVYKYGG
eukprot:CAMPEP_0173400178 /NCGR_PEP_ID=MMETSP1356-20130122/47182_1 /TAXON_ID=77927 ORGANISM="Hemiselmis virescens, Strain PCC157" /NCGR_SAMPLE_ID=MMETSP1356 /ASSEMBLY_ACC=CAM_ASM_000847 /LENGTH=123 /DNA_ID=CAMNT_0014360055 /DNA_START=1 /DNA_END=368 /DNA_ORIENTATION=-